MNILVAVDFSSGCDAVMEQAKRIVNGLGGRVWVLHVAEPDPDFVGYDVGPQTERDAVASHLREEHKQVQALAEGLRADHVEATALLVRGATAETIIEQANKLEAEMVVMGSHGKGAVASLLMGSVSEAVLREVNCPVVVVPTRS